MANRRIPEWLSSEPFTMTGYAWRGKGQQSELTGKQVRPVVAKDDKELYHSGVRNWSEAGNARPKDALYSHMKSHHVDYAIERAEHMCKVEVERHSQLKELAESQKMRSPAAKCAARQPIRTEKHARGLRQ